MAPRKEAAVRFRIRLELSIETQTVEDATAAMTRVENAAHNALGRAVAPDLETGALSRCDLSALDAAAVEGLATDDLGPGITSERRSYPRTSQADP